MNRQSVLINHNRCKEGYPHAPATRQRILTLLSMAIVFAVLSLLGIPPKHAVAQSDVVFAIADFTVSTAETTVTVPVSLVTPASVTLTGFRVELSYDATKLSVASCTLANLGFCNSATAGTVVFNGVNTGGIADGDVATIVFNITSGATGSSALTMSLSQILDASLTDITSSAIADDGSITIQADAVDVDDRMTRAIDFSTVAFTGPTNPPAASALLGSYNLDFQFTYSGSGLSLSGLYLQVNTATDAALLNADDGIGDVGSILTIDDTGLPGGDNVLDPTEMVAVPMVIGVNAAGWVLDFDLMGIEQTVTVSSNEPVQREVLLGRVVITEEDLSNVSQIYLPLVTAD